jgi:hypothetical protein
MGDEKKQEQKQESIVDIRLKKLEEIARLRESDYDSYEKEMGIDRGYSDEKPVDDVDAKEKQNVEDILGNPDEESEEEKQAKAEKDRKAEEKAKVKAKVDGVEEEVEIDYLVNQYQKFRHAEKEMEKAALERKRIREEYEMQQRELSLYKQQLDIQAQKMKELEQGQAQSAKQAEALPSQEDVIKKAVSNLFSGDEQQAAQSLQEAINAKVQAELERRLSQEATRIKQEAENKAAEVVARSQNSMRWEAAILQAQSKNPEFKTDEDLAILFEQRLMQAAQSGLPPEEAVASVTKQLERFVKPAETKVNDEKKGFQVSDADLRETEARKAESKRYSVDGKAVAVSGSKKIEEDRELTREEILAQLRRGRR